jgi:hypothetical protein
VSSTNFFQRADSVLRAALNCCGELAIDRKNVCACRPVRRARAMRWTRLLADIVAGHVPVTFISQSL